MNANDIITLSDGQTAKILKGDESDYKNIYVVMLENGQKRVIDKETLTVASNQPDYKYSHR